MTDPAPDAHPWLPVETVVAWLKVKADNAEKVALVELCRSAAADWIEDQRPDLFVTVVGVDPDPDVTTFEATGRIVMAGLLACQRLFGVGVAFQELGAGSFLKDDAEVKAYLGRNKNVPVG